MNYDFLKQSGKELKERCGTMDQFAQVRRSVIDDGKGNGIRIADVDNGSGLNFTVLVDRGMDICEARYKGIPFGWLSAIGYCHPAYFEKDEIGWLRTWPGGLVTGCGLRNVGVPTAKDGENFGLHGRLSHIPAENYVAEKKWVDDQYQLSVQGEMREVRMFGENLLLTRKISTVMGQNKIVIEDTIENQGYKPSQLMLLYHINIGYPVISEDSELVAVAHPVTPRDPVAEKGLEIWNQCQKPTPDYAEQCFYHDIPAEDDGLSRMSIRNPACGLELQLAYRKAELPFLTQWKQMGQGEYVVGLEPANCHPEGVNNEKDKFGSLKTIEPDEIVTAYLEIVINEL